MKQLRRILLTALLIAAGCVIAPREVKAEASTLTLVNDSSSNEITWTLDEREGVTSITFFEMSNNETEKSVTVDATSGTLDKETVLGICGAGSPSGTPYTISARIEGTATNVEVTDATTGKVYSPNIAVTPAGAATISYATVQKGFVNDTYSANCVPNFGYLFQSWNGNNTSSSRNDLKFGTSYTATLQVDPSSVNVSIPDLGTSISGGSTNTYSVAFTPTEADKSKFSVSAGSFSNCSASVHYDSGLNQIQISDVKGNGSFQLDAKYNGSNITGYPKTITVSTPVTGITIQGVSKLAKGNSATYSVDFNPTAAEGTLVTWKIGTNQSNYVNIANNSDGTVTLTGKAAGTVKLTATAGGTSHTFTIAVSNSLSNSVTGPKYAPVGATDLEYTATLYDTGGSVIDANDITWDVTEQNGDSISDYSIEIDTEGKLSVNGSASPRVIKVIAEATDSNDDTVSVSARMEVTITAVTEDSLSIGKFSAGITGEDSGTIYVTKGATTKFTITSSSESSFTKSALKVSSSVVSDQNQTSVSGKKATVSIKGTKTTEAGTLTVDYKGVSKDVDVVVGGAPAATYDKNKKTISVTMPEEDWIVSGTDKAKNLSEIQGGELAVYFAGKEIDLGSKLDTYQTKYKKAISGSGTTFTISEADVLAIAKLARDKQQSDFKDNDITLQYRIYPYGTNGNGSSGSTKGSDVYASVDAPLIHKITVEGTGISTKTYYGVEGEKLKIEATPLSGYTFSKWEDGTTSKSREITVGTEAKTYKAQTTGGKSGSAADTDGLDKVPKTGENAATVWMILFAAAAGTLAAVILLRSYFPRRKEDAAGAGVSDKEE